MTPLLAHGQAWDFDDAFPIKWTGPSFASATGEAAAESLHRPGAQQAG